LFNTTIYPTNVDFTEIIGKISSSIKVEELNQTAFNKSYELKQFDTRYKNEKYGFEIDLPIGWYYLEDVMGNAVQTDSINKDSVVVLSMGVNVQEEYDPEMTSEHYNRSIVSAVRKEMLVADKNQEISPVKFLHPEFVAHKSHFTGVVNDKKQTIFLYTTVKNKKGYMFIGMSYDDKLSENEKRFDDIFSSMTIK
jgi:hypothetical protein